MANEPQRPIEKLLHDCAEKRRQEIGGPLELHPVNRRALQAEVARVFLRERRASPGDERVGWPRFWPRFAWGVGVVAVLGLVVWSLPHAVNDNPKSIELAKTEAPTRTTLTAASSPAKPVPASESLLPPSQNEVLALAERSDQQPAKQTDPSLAFAAAPEKDSLASSGPAAAVALSSAPQTLSDRRFLNQPAPASLPQEEKAAVQRLTRSSLVQQTSVVARAERPSGGGAPLTSFRVEVAGDVIRVIDQDGSVYSGLIAAGPGANSVVNTSALSLQKAASADRVASNALTERESSTKDALGPQPTDRAFRVAGTNLSLNQQVVFTGRMLPITNQASVLAGRTQQKLPTQRTIQAAGAEPVSPSFRILGKAVVGAGPEIEIDAVPPK